MLHIAALVVGLVFGFAVFLDAFQTMVLPRRPSGRLRITRLFFFLTWTPWSAVAKRITNRNAREEVYGIYGPLSLLLLLVLWAILLILTFGLEFFALGSPLTVPRRVSSSSKGTTNEAGSFRERARMTDCAGVPSFVSARSSSKPAAPPPPRP